MRLLSVFAFFGFVSSAFAQPAPKTYPYEVTDPKEQENLIALMKKMQKAVQTLKDYTLTMLKKERIGNTLRPTETVRMKFRAPFSVYLRWIKEPYKDREVMFVRGWNNNKLIAREHSGFAGFFQSMSGPTSLEPTGSLAMNGSRHPITNAGLVKVMEIILRDINRYRARKDPFALMMEAPFQEEGRETQCVKFTGPKNAKSGYYSYRTRLCWGVKDLLIRHIQSWDWQDRLVEDYKYLNLRINVGLTDQDFNPKNPEYMFHGRKKR